MFDWNLEPEKQLDELEELLQRKQFPQLLTRLAEMEPADIALLFAELPEEQIPLLFRLLPKEVAAEVFVELEPEAQEMLIIGFSNRELKEVLDELYLDDAVDIVEEMPANVVKRILTQASPDVRRSINEILKYPEDSAGALMTTEFVDLRTNMTVAEAFARIRRTGSDKETINVCYVIDNNRILQGWLSIRTLLLAEETQIIGDIMDTGVIAVHTLDDREDVAQAFTHYDFIAMPVVDQEQRLVGIITVDDVMDVMEEETTEDFERMAAINPTDKPYLRSGVFETWLARVPWLMFLMLSATFTGLILAHYEAALASCLILNSFIPMLTGTGGNSGTQASVAVTRAISLGELSFSDLGYVLWKEFRVALMTGFSLAAVNFAKMLLVDGWMMSNPEVTVTVSLVVSLTLLLVVLAAKLTGCALPLLADKLGFDPAVMASPFITTIVDALSLLIYFAFASMLLGI